MLVIHSSKVSSSSSRLEENKSTTIILAGQHPVGGSYLAMEMSNPAYNPPVNQPCALCSIATCGIYGSC